MQQLYKAAARVLPVVLMFLAGCSGSGGGSAASDPFSQSGAAGGGTNQGTAAPITPGVTHDPAFNLTLTTDLSAPTALSSLPQVDANTGTVLLTATLAEAGVAMENQAVSFQVLAGPGSLGYATPLTDKNGVAKAIFSTGNVNYTTNVIVEASTSVAGNTYRAYTSFQIVRGSGVISMGSNGVLEPFKDTVAATQPAATVLQPIVFRVSDGNGNPRVGVPVTLSVYSQASDSLVVIDYLKNPADEPNQQTVTTDSSGTGIFNVSVTLRVPGPGMKNSEAIVFKAVTNDVVPVVGYVAGTYTITAEKAAAAP